MGRKRIQGSELCSAARVVGWGLAVFFLGSMATAMAQQAVTAPIVQSVTAAKETTPPAPPEVTKSSLNEYTVSPEDLLDIVVMDVPEVTRTYRVSANGMLSLPLLPEPVAAAGETLDQLSHVIAAKFREAGMLNNAQVSISLRETRQHTVLITGEVRKPQAYPVYGPTRLLDIIIQAGGLLDTAGGEAVITRGESGARADLEESDKADSANPTNDVTFTLNIHKLLLSADAESNIFLYPGDRVVIQRASMIYIMGAVVRPGGYILSETHQQITVLKAIAVAGDVTNVAKKGGIVILRRNPASTGEQRAEIPVNYKAMVKGHIADIRLKADDIVYIPESGRIKAMRTAMTALVATGTNAGSAMAMYRY